MKSRTFLWFLPVALLAVLAVWRCAAAGEVQTGEEKKTEEEVLVGAVTRDGIEKAVPRWVEAEVAAQPDAETARALATVEPGAEVTVFLGTWCGDSRREVPRLWKALDEAGAAVPFAVRYVGVDRAKKEPADAVAANGVRYLPTFIVRRGGGEVGRIVESAPDGIEKDLLALLTGKARGVLTLRDDLAAGEPKPHS